MKLQVLTRAKILKHWRANCFFFIFMGMLNLVFFCASKGLEPCSTSPGHRPAPYFTPIQSSECKEKVDILELLHKAKIDLKPLLSTLSVNKARLRESSECNFLKTISFFCLFFIWSQQGDQIVRDLPFYVSHVHILYTPHILKLCQVS